MGLKPRSLRPHQAAYQERAAKGLERALYLELLIERRGDWLPSKPEGEGLGSVSELPEAEFHLFHPGLAELASQTQKTGLWERKWVGSYSGQWFFWDHPVPQPVFSPQAHCPGPGFYPQGPGTAADKAGQAGHVYHSRPRAHRVKCVLLLMELKGH